MTRLDLLNALRSAPHAIGAAVMTGLVYAAAVSWADIIARLG